MRVAVVLNPCAGRNRRDRGRAGRLSRILGSNGVVHAPLGLDELERSIDAALATEPEVLAICGGDGSYFRAFSILERRLGGRPWPAILPLPGGTINNLVHAIGAASSSPEGLLRRVVSSLERGISLELATCDLFRVGADGVGYIFGAGMVVHFLRAYYARSPDPGGLEAARLLGALIVSGLLRGPLQRRIFQSFEADAFCDGERLPHRRFRQLLASSIATIGLGFRPFYLAGRKPGHFHVLGGPARASALIGRLPRYWHGCPAEHPEMYDNLAAEMRIEFAEPTHYTVNGDLLGPVERLELRALRRIAVVRG